MLVSLSVLRKSPTAGSDDVVHQCTAAEVVHRFGQALQHRADAHYLRAALHSLVGRVAGVEVWEDGPCLVVSIVITRARFAGELRLSSRSSCLRRATESLVVLRGGLL